MVVWMQLPPIILKGVSELGGMVLLAWVWRLGEGVSRQGVDSEVFYAQDSTQ